MEIQDKIRILESLVIERNHMVSEKDTFENILSVDYDVFIDSLDVAISNLKSNWMWHSVKASFKKRGICLPNTMLTKRENTEDKA